LTKYAGSIQAYVKREEKTGKVMMRKVATSRKSKTHTKMKKKTHFGLCVWLWSSPCFT